MKRVSDSCIRKGDPAALHTDSLLAENSLLLRAQFLLSLPSILYCCDVDPAVQSLWPLPDHWTSWLFSLRQAEWKNKIHSACYETLISICVWLLKLFAFFSHMLLWMDGGGSVLCSNCIEWLMKMRGEECVQRDCILPPVYCSASGSQEESHLAWELQNPTGISVASHRFVSTVFNCPTWTGFYGLWFPFDSVPVGRCEQISAFATASATLTRTAGNLSINGNSNACFIFSPTRKLHFCHFSHLRHMDGICCSISDKSSKYHLV